MSARFSSRWCGGERPNWRRWWRAPAPPTTEALTYSPDDPARDRWLQRTVSQTGERLGQVRDRLFAALDIQRHHTLLDLNARSGLLTWEAVRRVPEGGVYTRVETEQDRAALTEQAAMLPELDRPVIFFSRTGGTRGGVERSGSGGAVRSPGGAQRVWGDRADP